MEKTKTDKEIGIEEIRLWRQGHWRGHHIIGRYLIHRYGLTDDDLKIFTKEKQKYYMRTYRKKLKQSEKEVHISNV